MGTEESRQVILPFFRTSRPDQFWPPTLALLGELVFLPSPQTPAQPTTTFRLLCWRGVLKECFGGDVPLGPWNPLPIPELVQLNSATLY